MIDSEEVANVIGYSYVVPPCLEPANLEDRIGQEDLVTKIDSLPYLLDKKQSRFMSKLDHLMLAGACKAAKVAELSESALNQQTGLYLAGSTPTYYGEMYNEMSKSDAFRAEKFDAKKFYSEGWRSINPRHIFHGNPTYHISYNLKICGPNFLTPKIGIVALNRALTDLFCGKIEYAIFGVAEDLRNTFTENHFSRMSLCHLPVVDSACFLVLSTNRTKKTFCKLQRPKVEYKAVNPFGPKRPIKDSTRFKVYAPNVGPFLTLVFALETSTRGHKNVIQWEGNEGEKMSMEFEI